MLIQLEESQLIFVDYSTQQLKSALHTEHIARTAETLAKVAKLLQVPIWGVEQGTTEGLGMYSALKDSCQKVLSKTSFDACEHGLPDLLKGPAKNSQQGNARSLPKHLQKQEVSVEKMTVLLAGYETHISVLQTALSLVEQEFDVCLVTDACGAAHQNNHDAALDRLAGAGVELVTLEMVVFEWLGSSLHPSFDGVMKLLNR